LAVNQKARHLVNDDVGQRADRAGHYRDSAGHCFQRDDTGRFVRRGTRDHIGGPQQLRDFGDGGVRVHA
jgi:hypothetical protein